MNALQHRQIDRLESVISALHRHMLLLVVFPIAGAAIGYATSYVLPKTYVATVNIPAPPFAVSAYRDFVRSSGSPFADRAYLISKGESRQKALAPINNALNEAKLMARKAVEREEERLRTLSYLERNILDLLTDSKTVVADEAQALAETTLLSAGIEVRVMQLRRWERSIPQAAINEKGSKLAVPFGAFSGLSAALGISAISAIRDHRRRGSASPDHV